MWRPSPARAGAYPGLESRAQLSHRWADVDPKGTLQAPARRMPEALNSTSLGALRRVRSSPAEMDGEAMAWVAKWRSWDHGLPLSVKGRTHS